MVEPTIPSLAVTRPPDLLALRAAPLPRLLEVLDELAGDAADERFRQALAVVADLAVDESVRLIRRAPRAEVVDANAALSRWCSGAGGRALEAIDPGTHGVVAGLLFVLAAAAAPDGKDGDALVLRSWNGKAREAVELVAAAAEQRLPRAELRRMLGVGESYLSHLLADLEAASLVERIGMPGRRGVDVHLGGKGHALARARAAPVEAPQAAGDAAAVRPVPAPAPAPAPARPAPARLVPRRGVARARDPELGRRTAGGREGRALRVT